MSKKEWLDDKWMSSKPFSPEERQRLLECLRKHEEKHREFRGNIPVDYAINKQMEETE